MKTENLFHGEISIELIFGALLTFDYVCKQIEIRIIYDK